MRYTKDNRLLPRGFDPAGASADIAVRGEASADPTFIGGSDRVRYRVAGPWPTRPLRARLVPARGRAALPADRVPLGPNLAAYDAPETRRFVGFYDAAAGESATVLARANVAVDID